MARPTQHARRKRGKQFKRPRSQRSRSARRVRRQRTTPVWASPNQQERVAFEEKLVHLILEKVDQLTEAGKEKLLELLSALLDEEARAREMAEKQGTLF